MPASIDDFWRNFGCNRFTKSDLWKAFGYNVSPGFPTQSFLQGLYLEERDYVIAAPGPRGGEGWKLSDECILLCLKKDKAEKLHHEKLSALVESKKIRYGKLIYNIQLCEIFWQFKLPYEFVSHFPTYMRKCNWKLEFTIDTKKQSFKKTQAILEHNCNQIEFIVLATFHKEHDYLEKHLTVLRDFLVNNESQPKINARL